MTGILENIVAENVRLNRLELCFVVDKFNELSAGTRLLVIAALESDEDTVTYHAVNLLYELLAAPERNAELNRYLTNHGLRDHSQWLLPQVDPVRRRRIELYFKKCTTHLPPRYSDVHISRPSVSDMSHLQEH